MEAVLGKIATLVKGQVSGLKNKVKTIKLFKIIFINSYFPPTIIPSTCIVGELVE